MGQVVVQKYSPCVARQLDPQMDQRPKSESSYSANIIRPTGEERDKARYGSVRSKGDGSYFRRVDQDREGAKEVFHGFNDEIGFNGVVTRRRHLWIEGPKESELNLIACHRIAI